MSGESEGNIQRYLSHQHQFYSVAQGLFQTRWYFPQRLQFCTEKAAHHFIVSSWFWKLLWWSWDLKYWYLVQQTHLRIVFFETLPCRWAKGFQTMNFVSGDIVFLWIIYFTIFHSDSKFCQEYLTWNSILTFSINYSKVFIYFHRNRANWRFVQTAVRCGLSKRALSLMWWIHLHHWVHVVTLFAKSFIAAEEQYLKSRLPHLIKLYSTW